MTSERLKIHKKYMPSEQDLEEWVGHVRPPSTQGTLLLATAHTVSFQSLFEAAENNRRCFMPPCGMPLTTDSAQTALSDANNHCLGSNDVCFGAKVVLRNSTLLVLSSLPRRDTPECPACLLAHPGQRQIGPITQ